MAVDAAVRHLCVGKSGAINIPVLGGHHQRASGEPKHLILGAICCGFILQPLVFSKDPLRLPPLRSTASFARVVEVDVHGRNPLAHFSDNEHTYIDRRNILISEHETVVPLHCVVV